MENDSQINNAQAFHALDQYFFLSVEESSPDAAFDWIYMMHDEDWHLLTEAWKVRPPEWRESCAYILGEGPTLEGFPLLRQALFDENLNVAVQAACAITSQRNYLNELVDMDEFVNPDEFVDLDEEIVSRLENIVILSESEYMEDVIELIHLLRNPPDRSIS